METYTAGTDMLSKALSMAERVRAGAGRGPVFGDALLRTMSGAGDYHATLAIPQYPRDAQRRDLERLGKDMYRALEQHAETQAPRSN